MPFSLRGRKTRSDVCWKLIFGYVMYFDTFFPFLLKLVFKKVRIDGFDGFFNFAWAGRSFTNCFFLEVVENLILNLLVLIRVFRMVCNPYK